MDVTEDLLTEESLSTEYKEHEAKLRNDEPSDITGLYRYFRRTKYVVVLVCMKILICNGCTAGISIFLYITEKKQEINEAQVNVSKVVLYLTTSLIIIAVLLALASCLAFIAALRENPRILTWYAQILMLAVIFQFGMVVVGSVFLGKVDRQIQGIVSWNTLIKHYFNDPEIHSTIDTIQKNLGCCGFTDYNDWEMNEEYSCMSSNPTLACSVPSSCCKKESQNCAVQARSSFKNETNVAEIIRTTGCLKVVQDWYRYNFILLIATSVFLAVSQILAYWAIQKFIYFINFKKSTRACKSTSKRIQRKQPDFSLLMSTQKAKAKKGILTELREYINMVQRCLQVYFIQTLQNKAIY